MGTQRPWALLGGENPSWEDRGVSLSTHVKRDNTKEGKELMKLRTGADTKASANWSQINTGGTWHRDF